MAQKPRQTTIQNSLSLTCKKGQRFSFAVDPKGGGMKKGWFTHTGLTTEEANDLVARYQGKGVPVEKSLDVDPRFWIVSALLPEQSSPPKNAAKPALTGMEVIVKVYNILPVGKPRMTRADKWKKRPEVMRYRAFCDHVRLLGVELPESNSHITFILPMPQSWSKKKRLQFDGQPHQSKPDFDNLVKALSDAIYADDAHIWDARITKLWGEAGQIIIREIA